MNILKRIQRRLDLWLKIGWARYDIGDKTYNWVLERSPYPDRLTELVTLGRRTFGWYSKQLSRSFENPWVLHHVLEHGGSDVLDIGAGVSPLPLCLAAHGWNVTTIDNHPTALTPGYERIWNDWGYVDYSLYSPRIHSHQVDASALTLPLASLDCIYSVSVLEHVPSATRRIIWERCYEWLREGGSLLLTFDLILGTTQLWNQIEGQQVETSQLHGSVETIQSELELLGFRLVESMYIRELPTSRVDTAFLRLEKATH